MERVRAKGNTKGNANESDTIEHVLQRYCHLTGRLRIARRRCLVSRSRQWQAAMIRFVIGPAALVIPDVRANLPGRGFWLSARRDMLETALRKRLFAKAARQPVTVPVNLSEQVDGLLVRYVLDLIGLGRRAGIIVCGYEQVVSVVRARQAFMLIKARTSSCKRSEFIWNLRYGLPVVNLFSVCALGAAMGRSEVMHAAVKKGSMAEVLLLEASRLACYRGLMNEMRSRFA